MEKRILPLILAVVLVPLAVPRSLSAQGLVPVNSRREVGWGNRPEPLPEPIQPQELDQLTLPRPIESIEPDYVGGPTRTADVITQRYPDGRPHVTRRIMQDEEGSFLNHGEWKLFSRRGDVMAEGNFREGLMDGAWQRWHAANSETLFLEPPFNQFTGPYLSTATFAAGKLDGAWTIFDRNRQKIFEMPYVNGKRNGRATWYFPNSQPMREVDFQDGQLHGQLVEYNRQGRRARESTFDRGQEIITRTDWYYRGQKQTEQMWLGPKMEFLTEDDWWNAQPAGYEATGEELQHGPTREWYSNGQLRLAGQYKEGKRVGTFMWWHENGRKQIEGQFLDGMKTGTWRWFHANGKRAIEGDYLQNVESGSWTWWDEFGALEDQRDFSMETLDAIETLENSSSDDDSFPDLSIDIDT